MKEVRVKIIKRSIFLLLAACSLGYASEKSAILKSFILPGWGEYSLNESGRAKEFFCVEVSLWVSYAGTSIYKEIQYDDMVHYAKAHSGATSFHGSSQYWVDMGSYLSWEKYRDEMLENRMPEKIYNEDYAWNWESLEHANTFREIRIQKDLTEQRMSFIVGAMIFNRLLSVIDVMYLNRSIDSAVAPTPNGTAFYLSIPLRP